MVFKSNIKIQFQRLSFINEFTHIENGMQHQNYNLPRSMVFDMSVKSIL